MEEKFPSKQIIANVPEYARPERVEVDPEDEILPELFKQGHSLAAWNAYRSARSKDKPIPEWVLKYFDTVAMKLQPPEPEICLACEILSEDGIKRYANLWNTSESRIIDHIKRHKPVVDRKNKEQENKWSGIPPRDRILEALGMKVRGKGNIFRRYKEAYWRMNTVMDAIEQIILHPERMKADIFSEVAKDLENDGIYLSNVTIENWYNALKDTPPLSQELITTANVRELNEWIIKQKPKDI